MAELTDRQLDAWIAKKVMGWTYEDGDRNTWTHWVDPNGEPHYPPLNFSSDRNATAQVLKRIAELNLKDEFIEEMECGVKWQSESELWWFYFTATPRQICEAALKAVGAVRGKGSERLRLRNQGRNDGN